MVDSIQFKKVWGVRPAVQIFVICALFAATTLLANTSYQETGLAFGMPLTMAVLFAPIYEEVIFRGWIFGELSKHHSAVRSVVFTSLLFGLWHLKNIFHFELADCIYQMVYAAVIIGPILAVVRLKTGTVWPGVILHYLNNLASLVLVMASMDWREVF